jgi:hypothetical protein
MANKALELTSMRGRFILSSPPVADANHHVVVALHAQTSHRICRVFQAPPQALGAPVSESLQVYRLRRRTPSYAFSI